MRSLLEIWENLVTWFFEGFTYAFLFFVTPIFLIVAAIALVLAIFDNSSSTCNSGLYKKHSYFSGKVYVTKYECVPLDKVKE